MTHSHDKTILARLGFQDPDAKEPLHDLACEYMALEENVLKLRPIVHRLESETVGEEIESSSLRIEADTDRGFKFLWGQFKYKITCVTSHAWSHVESALTKGEGQYLVTVGFIDVDANWNVTHARLGTQNVNGQTTELNDGYTHDGRIVIEVKIQPVTIGDLVRQMNLYRTHLPNRPAPDLVVAVAFDVNEYYRSALEREGITLVRLGERFGKWATEKHDASPVNLQEF